MPGIKSELTNKNFDSTNKLKEIEIPDETGYYPQQNFESTNNNLDIDAINNLMAERNLPPLDPNVVSAFNARQVAARGVQSGGRKSDPKELAAFEQQVSDARRARITGKEKLSASAKQRIEMLCGISRGVRSVDIDGNKFILKTLKGKEQRAAIIAASEFDNSIQSPFEIRKQLLARAVTDIAGTDIELFLGDSSLDARLEFMEELDEHVLAKLFSEYLILVHETKSKYFMTSEKDAKEVSEDLKK